MKNRKNLIMLFSLTITLSLTGVYASTAVNESTDSNSTVSSEKAENKIKVETRLNTVWQDIKKTHNINEDDYIELDIGKLNRFLSGKLEGYTDKDLIDEMNKILAENLFNAPVGSTKPKILLNKAGNEIVFAYKESDGKNTLNVFRKTEKNVLTPEEKSLNDVIFENIVQKSEGDPIPELAPTIWLN